jgi:hypothetical protein
VNKPHHNSLIANRSDPGSENKLDIIQNLVPTHYVYNGYLFLQSESLDVDCSGFEFKVYNATFNNISVILLRAVLLVKEISSVAVSCSVFDFDRQSLCIVHVCCYIHVVMKKIPLSEIPSESSTLICQQRPFDN